MPRVEALHLGAVTLFWLDGGGFRLDGGSIFGPVPRPRWSSVYPPAHDNTVPLTARVILIQDGASYGLLESGFGHHLDERQRRFYSLERESQLEQGLAELGISHRRVDWVVLSHLHLDHAGGVMSADGPVFPNAAVHVQQLEIAAARDQTNRAPGLYTRDSVDRLEALGMLRVADGAAEVTAHVSVALTGGHSRGHQATLVRATASGPAGASGASGASGERGSSAAAPHAEPAALLYLGELLATAAHLPPAWVSTFDDFPLDSIRAKREWLSRAASAGWWVAFAHDAHTTAGRLGSDGKLAEQRRPA